MRRTIAGTYLALLACAAVAFVAVAPPAAARGRPHPIPHSTHAPGYPTWGSPTWLMLDTNPSCEHLVLHYDDGTTVPMCWQPNCTIEIRDLAPPTVDCGAVVLHPRPPLPKPIATAYYD